MQTTNEKPARLNFRLPPEIKDRIEKAAIVSGLTVTDFAISTLASRADEVLERHHVRVLSDRDRDIFLAMLDRDDEPNEALKKGFAEYQEYLQARRKAGENEAE